MDATKIFYYLYKGLIKKEKKGKAMTIKRRLFISNIRIVLIAFAAFGLIVRIVGFLFFGSGKPDPETIANLRASYGQYFLMLVWVLVIALFIILISLLNNFLTNIQTKRIVKTLEPLNEGVRQIHDNNFAYRINYQSNDEFQPICDAFNEMAAKLETSTAQQKKDEANRRELIAGISHDLRTPLTSIKGYIEGIEAGVASTPEMREKYLAIIKNKAAVMEHIIEQLFLFSKLDMDEFPLTMRRVNISTAVSDMIEDSVNEYASRGLAIQFAEMPKDIFVSADVLLLRNVIINILENSVKYKTLEHGKMEISVAVVNDSMLLRLADDGPGVQADMLPKLFDVFYRADPSRSKLGSGLGLAISVKIIERMGGSIYAELPATGGLAIVIRLPLQKGEVQ
jgi:signal transduction histidine kinase